MEELTGETFKQGILTDERPKELSFKLENEIREKLEKRKARKRGWYAKLTEEQKEMNRAYKRYRRTLVTDEERERMNACQRNYRKKRKASKDMEENEEQKEKRKAYLRHRWANTPEEEKERINAGKRGVYATMSSDQKEKKRAYQRHRWATATHEERERSNAYRREYRKMRKVSGNVKEDQLGEIENIPRRPRSVKLARGETNDWSSITGAAGCVKSTHIIDERCETSSNVNVEERTFRIVELDHFEECEDWKTRIKMDHTDAV